MPKYCVARDTSENDDWIAFEETIEATSIEEAAQLWLERRIESWHANNPGEPYYDVIVTTPAGEIKKVMVQIDHDEHDGDVPGPCFIC